LLDGLVGEIPLVGLLTGYVLHPAYRVSRVGGAEAPVLRAVKKPAFFEGRYTLEQVEALGPSEQTPAVLAVLMMLLLERGRS